MTIDALKDIFIDFVEDYEGDVSTSGGLSKFTNELNNLFESYKVEMGAGKELLPYCGVLDVVGKDTPSYMIIDALGESQSLCKPPN